MRKYIYILLFSALAAFLPSCTDDGTPKPTPGTQKNDLAGIDKWIYDNLCGWYYWNDALKAAVIPDKSLAYDDFLGQLVANAYIKGAYDTTENPPTIDGYTDSYYGRRYYSNIERSGTTRAAGEELSFGFEIDGVRVASSPSRYWFVVKLVQPDSPASRAGLKRGMIITQYEGGAIGDNQWDEFVYQLYNMIGDGTMSFTVSGYSTPFTVTAAGTVIDPIIYHDVITTGKGTKVAYLVYNQFTAGPTGASNDVGFNDELITVFEEFRSEGATELVLDLRYNPGGDVNCSNLLTSLIGQVTANDVFAKLLRNKDISKVYKVSNPQVLKFRQDGISSGLGLNKVYVLATAGTASASEMVISSLRGILGNEAVVHIGATTNGKNVGMDVLTGNVGGYSYTMSAITFKILNSVDFCNYAGGFKPNVAIDEFWELINSSSPVIYDFGDVNERMLAAALTLIDGGTPTPDPATRTTRSDNDDRRLKTFYAPARGGAKYYPQESEIQKAI